jgi:predicted SnoaL-like aldol condensation-catalyzing enzyme
MTNNSNDTSKKAAVDFLQLVVAGRIDKAYDRYVDMTGKHHNPFFPAGFSSLKKAMAENESQSPNKKLDVAHVLADGDLVAVHSRLAFGADQPDMTVVHLFRFAGGKVVEMWDVAQQIPPESPNEDGAI